MSTQLPRDPAPATIADAVVLRKQAVKRLRASKDRRVIKRDWREDVVYFLLPDRFNSADRPDLDILEPAAMPDPKDQIDARWDFWAISGRNRFQGGTIDGITAKLDYLQELGVTALWVGPLWQQRVASVESNSIRSLARNQTKPDPTPAGDDLPDGMTAAQAFAITNPATDYHAYAIQDFLQIDPRFGTTSSLQRLIRKAHRRNMRVILDIVIHHSGENWQYAEDDPLFPPFHERQQPYKFSAFLDASNVPMPSGMGADSPRECGVWPRELQDRNVYHRRGFAQWDDGPRFSFGADREFRTADWMCRTFDYDRGGPSRAASTSMLDHMVDIWTYWIAKTDCDGFRIDTFKHVPVPIAAAFTTRVRKFAKKIGKKDFFVVGEVADSDTVSAEYLSLKGTPGVVDDPRVRVLELGERRAALRQLTSAQNLSPSTGEAQQVLMPYLPHVDLTRLRDRVMTSLDDHDDAGVSLQRFVAENGVAGLIPAAALLLFGPGVPMLYYGTEQALCGPVSPKWLGGYGYEDRSQSGDRYVREAMFAPRYPRYSGAAGLLAGTAGIDPRLPGFRPGGPPAVPMVRGLNIDDYFDTSSSTFVALRALLTARRQHPPLARGDIELCALRTKSTPFTAESASVYAWTRGDASGFGLIVINVDRLRSHQRVVQLPLSVAGRTVTMLADVNQHGANSRSAQLTARAATQLPFAELTVRLEPASAQVWIGP